MTVPDEKPTNPLGGLADRSGPGIVDAVRREYPNSPRHTMRDADDRPTPREIHPAFYGCFDWHSAVEMHWALVRLIRAAPSAPMVPAARTVLEEHLSADNLIAERDYLLANPSFERPYGWGWALTLADALADWADAGTDADTEYHSDADSGPVAGDDDAARSRDNLRPLADAVEAAFLAWLPRPERPDRGGMHGNSAFALDRSLPWARRRARAGDTGLLDAIVDASGRWFGADTDYSAAFEPGGSDFLSPALTEIVLMREVLEPREFDGWFRRFSGGRVPANLTGPVRVTDPEDGQGAHLHGLNLYRLHALRRLRDSTGSEDGRRWLELAADAHERAGAEALAAQGWMAEHWLAAYGVLAFG